MVFINNLEQPLKDQVLIARAIIRNYKKADRLIELNKLGYTIYYGATRSGGVNSIHEFKDHYKLSVTAQTQWRFAYYVKFEKNTTK